MHKTAFIVAMTMLASAPLAAQRSAAPLIELWSQAKPAFGVFVPRYTTTCS
jgi:hypothetical protein